MEIVGIPKPDAAIAEVTRFVSRSWYRFLKFLSDTQVRVGTFTLGAAASTPVVEPVVRSTSRIAITPTNAAAGALMAGTKALYISAKTDNTGFTVTTADGTAAAGTEQFDYLVRP